MIDIYYFLLIFPIMFEFGALRNPKLLIDYRRKIADPDIDFNGNLAFGVFNILYVILALIGLFTNQWLLFLLLFLGHIIFGKSKKVTNTSIIIETLDHLFSFIILIFILVNQYHLHLNLIDLLFNIKG